MEAAEIIRRCRSRAGLTLRALGAAAGTSHSTLAAYESGSKIPNTATLDRIVRSSGYAIDVALAPRVTRGRGDELAAVLELAAEFPARHDPHLTYPVFGR